MLGCFWPAPLISYKMPPLSTDLLSLLQSFIEGDTNLSNIKWTANPSNSNTLESRYVTKPPNVKGKLRCKCKKNIASTIVTSTLFGSVVIIFDSKWFKIADFGVLWVLPSTWESESGIEVNG